MSRWFRVYDDLVDDPKVQRLSDSLFRGIVNLWCLASQSDGVLPTVGDIAFKLRIKPAQAQKLLGELRNAGLIVDDETGTHPHNWNGRQFKSDVSNERVKQHRERKRNVTPTVTATPPETETETETETEQIQNTDQSRKKETREVALSSGEPSDFEAFWDEWPNKVGKPAALKAFNSAIKRGAGLWDIQDGLRNYIRDKPPDRPWLNPATFLNQNRWEDQPATVQGTPNGRRTVQQAADDLLEKLRAFDEPAPSNLCDGTGENAVRLLPSR